MSVPYRPILDPQYSLSAGHIKNTFTFDVFGYRDNIQSGTLQYVWSGAGSLSFPSDTGDALVVRSTSASDTQPVLIRTLDQDGSWSEQIVTLTGTTPVTLAGSHSRVNQLVNVSDTEFVGNIYVSLASNTSVNYCHCAPAENPSASAVFSVPAGYEAKLGASIATIYEYQGSSGALSFRAGLNLFGGVKYSFGRFGLTTTANSVVVFDVATIAPAPARSDIFVKVLSKDQAASAAIRMPLVLHKTA